MDEVEEAELVESDVCFEYGYWGFNFTSCVHSPTLFSSKNVNFDMGLFFFSSYPASVINGFAP